MKKYILIYAYTFFSKEEVIFWNSVQDYFDLKGYALFLLAPVKPKHDLKCEHALFTEKLSDVSTNDFFNLGKPDSLILKREETWYGKSKIDLSSAYFQQKRKYAVLLKELNPCFALIANGHHASELILINGLQKKQINYAFFERGCLTKTWHIDKEGITAGSSIAKLTLEHLSYSDTSFFELYSKEYFSSEETWWAQPENKWSKDKLYKRFGIQENIPVILFANQLDNDTSNFLYSDLFKDNLSSFEWLIKSIKSVNIDCFVIVKKHPHYKGSKEVFENVLKKHDVKGEWIEDIPLKDCISFSNYISAVNSTMILDGFMVEKPTLTLGRSIYSNKNIFWEISSKDDIDVIKSWLSATGIKNRLNNFRIFLSYMIEHELYFFSTNIDSRKFLGSEDFSAKVLSFVDQERFGHFPTGYHTIQNKNQNVQANSVVKKIFRFLKSKIAFL